MWKNLHTLGERKHSASTEQRKHMFLFQVTQTDLERESPQEGTTDMDPQKPNTLKITVQTSRDKCTPPRIEDVVFSLLVDLTQIR